MHILKKLNVPIFYFWANIARYTVSRRLGEPQSQSGCFAQKRQILCLSRQSSHDFSHICPFAKSLCRLSCFGLQFFMCVGTIFMFSFRSVVLLILTQGSIFWSLIIRIGHTTVFKKLAASVSRVVPSWFLLKEFLEVENLLTNPIRIQTFHDFRVFC